MKFKALFLFYGAITSANLIPPLDLKKLEQEFLERKKQDAQNMLKRQEKTQREQTAMLANAGKDSLFIQAQAHECLSKVTQLVQELVKKVSDRLNAIAAKEGHATIMYHRLNKNHATRDKEALDSLGDQIISLQDQAHGFLKSLKAIEKNVNDFLQHLNQEHAPQRTHAPGESA